MLDNARRLHAFFCAPDRLENDKPVSGGEIARVDDVDVFILCRGKARILIAAGKFLRNADVDHKIVFARQRGKRAHIVRQIDCRRGRQRAAGCDVLVNIVRKNIDAVLISPVSQLDIQRQNADGIAPNLLRA